MAYTSAQIVQAVPTGVGVLQVVTATYATATTTTSASYVTTGLTASITPKSTTSRVLILTMQAANGNPTDETCFTIFRGTVADTNLGVAAGMGTLLNTYETVSLSFLDSPSTTSAQAYTVGFKNLSGAGTSRVQTGNRTASITLIEISA